MFKFILDLNDQKPGRWIDSYVAASGAPISKHDLPSFGNLANSPFSIHVT